MGWSAALELMTMELPLVVPPTGSSQEQHQPRELWPEPRLGSGISTILPMQPLAQHRRPHHLTSGDGYATSPMPDLSRGGHIASA